AALAFAHFMRQHHRPHDTITILGIFFLPILITIMAFRDILSWILLTVYTVSAISTIIIYYYHKKVHTPLKIMWQVTYSRIIAITLAVILACILPYLVLGNAFVSIPELIFIYILPIAFVFFFASKFFYTYFFDRKHIVADLLKSLRYTITYTLVFIILLMCIYSLFAVSFYNSRSEIYGAGLDMAILGVSNVENSMTDMPDDMSGLIVVKDVEAFTSNLGDEVSLEKNMAEEKMISFGEILDDSYFSEIGDAAFNIVRFVVLQSELAAVKENIVLKYEGSKDLDIGSLESKTERIKADVEQRFVPASQDPDMMDTLAEVNDPLATYDYFESNGLFFIFAEESGLDFIYGSDSIFSRQMSLVLRHTEIFRQMTKLLVNVMVFVNKEADTPSVVEHLYMNRGADLLPISSAIRYSIIQDSLDERDARSEEANRITFRVEN
ncbi:TPA: hypothetical protein HA265_05255, partial [Candidatus Woesearchaeota archaeon]|nr:hypothetical protein [Candidatus Woesearchaeota archaeon]